MDTVSRAWKVLPLIFFFAVSVDCEIVRSTTTGGIILMEIYFHVIYDVMLIEIILKLFNDWKSFFRQEVSYEEYKFVLWSNN